MMTTHVSRQEAALQEQREALEQQVTASAEAAKVAGDQVQLVVDEMNEEVEQVLVFSAYIHLPCELATSPT
jgi:uncharacterized FlaG/YvyC family protein